MRLAHITLAVTFITGLVGRAAAFRQARNAATLEVTAALLALSDWFDRRLVVPGSIFVLLSGIVVAWTGHWPLLTGARHPTWLLASLALLLLPIGLIPTVLIPQRARRQEALAGALHFGQRTPELDAALRSVVVFRARMLELGIVTLVFALMVVKPF